MAQTQETHSRKQDAGTQKHLEFLKLRQVCSRIGYGKSWLWSSVKAKRFPAPIKVGTSARWVNEAVENWMRDQIERNQSGQGA